MKFQDFLLEDKLDYIADRQGQRLIDQALEDKGVVRPMPAKDLKAVKKEGVKSESFKEAVLKHLKWFADKFSHKYLQWVVNMYLKGGEFFFEDSDRVSELLKEFDKHKSRLEVRDLMRYKSLAELRTALAPYEETDEVKSNRQKEREEIQKMKDDGDLKLIGEGPNFKLYTPKTHQAACYLGRGTTWCTSMKNDEGFFKSYSRQGPLFIIVGSEGKYQLHMQTRQVTDHNDARASVSTILDKYPQVADLLAPFAEKSGYLPLLKDPSPEALAKAVKKGQQSDVEDVIQSARGKELPAEVQTALVSMIKKKDMPYTLWLNNPRAFSIDNLDSLIRGESNYSWMERLIKVADRDSRFTEKAVEKILEEWGREIDGLGKQIVEGNLVKLKDATREIFENIFKKKFRALKQNEQFKIVKDLTYTYGEKTKVDEFELLADLLELSASWIDDYIIEYPDEFKSIRHPTGKQKEKVRWALARERDERFR